MTPCLNDICETAIQTDVTHPKVHQLLSGEETGAGGDRRFKSLSWHWSGRRMKPRTTRPWPARDVVTVTMLKPAEDHHLPWRQQPVSWEKLTQGPTVVHVCAVYMYVVTGKCRIIKCIFFLQTNWESTGKIVRIVKIVAKVMKICCHCERE